MSLRDLCDVAYVLQVEQLERRAVALSSAVASEESATLPDRLRAEFDAALVAVPKPARSSPRARSVAKALGLR